VIPTPTAPLFAVRKECGVTRPLPIHWLRHALLMGGVLLIAIGLWPASPSAAPRKVVTLFVKALEHGDRAAALLLMGDEARAQATGPAFPEVWQPSKSFTWTLKDLRVDGATALARVLLRDSGFFVESELRLSRGSTGEWQIVSLTIDRVDPRFAERQRRQAEEADARLAQELRDAVQGSPAVLTDLPDDSPRR
jgi:hypothetical protein